METQKTELYTGHTIHQECLDSSIRSLRMVQETISLGSETMEMLENQGNQLEKIDVSLSGIHNFLNTAERHLRSIKSISGSIYNKFVPQWDGNITKKISHTEKQNQIPEKMDGNIPPQFGMGNSFSKTESKIDENLVEISKGVDILHRIAIEQNNELDRQNKIIDSIRSGVDTSNRRITMMNNEMKKLN